MPNELITQSVLVADSMSVTIVGSQNMAPAASWAMPTSNVCSYTAPGENMSTCSPLSEGAIRLGNSLLTAYVPEDAILRDTTEGF